ncbi:MAG TPA: hypothetical protein VHC19_05230 [Pirellulales bacterium]|nr:hypothetical protein [Pirellulales bacterium]
MQCLLMGGQACILYGGAEFSRDTDLAVLADVENLLRLRAALDELQASYIAVPPFERAWLDLGLAVHFRCNHPEVEGMRVDVMSQMRGVEPFPALWQRRTTLDFGDDVLDVISLPDLVQAKKTQRAKDWPMIARLVEANYFQHQDQPSPEQIQFWLKELRTSSLLIDVARRFSTACDRLMPTRDLLTLAKAGDQPALEAALRTEEQREREADRLYWLPLKQELERLRRAARKS